MKVRVLYLIIIFSNLVLNMNLFGQITPVKDENGFLEGFNFYNRGYYNLIEIDPFILNRKIDYEHKGQVTYQNIKLSEISRFTDRSNISWLNNIEPANSAQLDLNITPLWFLNENYLITAYFMRINSKQGNLGQTTIFTIYDSIGNSIFQTQLPYDCEDVILIPDNAIFGFVCGGPLNDNLERIVTDQVILFDYHHNKICSRIISTDDSHVTGLGHYNNLIYTRLDFPQEEKLILYFFETDKSVLYSTELTYEQNRRIVEFNSDGIVLSKVPNGKSKDLFLFFDSDFEKKEIK